MTERHTYYCIYCNWTGPVILTIIKNKKITCPCCGKGRLRSVKPKLFKPIADIMNFGFNVPKCVENRSRHKVPNSYHIKTYKKNADQDFARFAKNKGLRLMSE